MCGGRIDDDLKEYDLENYDEPTEEEKKTGEGMGDLWGYCECP